MTDRIKGLTVTLEIDYRDDDVKAIVDAITMIRGVAHVATHVADIDDHMNRQRVKHEFLGELAALHKKISQ